MNHDYQLKNIKILILILINYEYIQRLYYLIKMIILFYF